MIKKTFLFTLLLAFFINGCAGKRMATFKVEKDGTINYQDKNISLLEPSICPKQLTEAYFIKTQADMIRGATNSNAGSKFKYTFVAVNVTPERAYIFHPELGINLPLAANDGSQFLYLNNIPTRVYFKNSKKKIVWKPQPNRIKMEEKKIFRGVPNVDLILTLERQ